MFDVGEQQLAQDKLINSVVESETDFPPFGTSHGVFHSIFRNKELRS
jgi:hypothetical protein